MVSMATLQLADCSKPVILLKPSLSSLFATTPRHFRFPQAPSRFIPKAASSSSPPPPQQSSICRRRFIAESTTISLSLAAPFLGSVQPAHSEEPALSEWERVYLPIDPGVVLLDVAFVPDDLNHGELFAQLSSYVSPRCLVAQKVKESVSVLCSLSSVQAEGFNYLRSVLSISFFLRVAFFVLLLFLLILIGH